MTISIRIGRPAPDVPVSAYVRGEPEARRLALHRHFNHNDLYHVIQIVALYLFYRGGALLVDR